MNTYSQLTQIQRYKFYTLLKMGHLQSEIVKLPQAWGCIDPLQAVSFNATQAKGDNDPNKQIRKHKQGAKKESHGSVIRIGV